MTYPNQIHKYSFDHPEVLEAVHQARFQPETNFLIQLFQQHGGISRVLDVACGTGAHAARLSRAGYSATCLDLNANMVKFARTKHGGLDFLVGDMRALPFSQAFDAVMCLCTSFSYNTTNEEVVAALCGFHRALHPGGLAIIDVFNPISLIETRGFLDEIKEPYKEFGMYAVIQPTISARHQQLVERRTLFALPQHEPIQTDVTRYRLFFPQELR